MNLKTLCFIPCCGAKTPTFTPESDRELWYNTLDVNISPLLRGRQEMADSLKSNLPTKAIDLYTGNFYHPLDKKLIKSEISSGHLRLFIISAGYGLTDANEQICDYDAEMKGKTARMWRDNGLVDVIAKVIQTLNADQVFGFFSGLSNWSGSGSNYRFFFSEGLKSAITRGYCPIRAGCFYRFAGFGQIFIPKTLGNCFRDALQVNFSKDYLLQMENNTLQYSNELPIIVKYESFV